MNNRKEIEWIITEIAPSMIKLEASPLGKLPTFEEFKQKAKELLSNLEKASDNLKIDENRSQDLGDLFLLKMELPDLGKEEKKVKSVLFTVGNNQVIANKKNIENLKESEGRNKIPVNEFGANPDITEQVLEDWER